MKKFNIFLERGKLFDIREHLSHRSSNVSFSHPFDDRKRRNRIQKKKNQIFIIPQKSISLSYYQSTRLTESIPLGNIYISFFFSPFLFFSFPNFSLEGIRFPVYRGLIKGRCATRNKVHRDRCFVAGQINWNSRSNLLVSNAKKERRSLILEWRCMNRGMQYIFHLVLILLVSTGSHPRYFTIDYVSCRWWITCRMDNRRFSDYLSRWSRLLDWIWIEFSKIELSRFTWLSRISVKWYNSFKSSIIRNTWLFMNDLRLKLFIIFLIDNFLFFLLLKIFIQIWWDWI